MANQAPNATTRKKVTNAKTKRVTLVATCKAGHTNEVPDTGLGRASLATWETRHQHCVAKAK